MIYQYKHFNNILYIYIFRENKLSYIVYGTIRILLSGGQILHTDYLVHHKYEKSTYSRQALTFVWITEHQRTTPFDVGKKR